MLGLTHSAKCSWCIITCCYCAYLPLIMLCGVNEVNKLMHVHFLSINIIFCEVLLSHNRVLAWLQTPASCNPPPASTSGETSPSSQVLPKGPIVGVLLVHC
jgi:hypothetical protein